MANTYSPEQLEFIRIAWTARATASEISAQFYVKFRVYVSRSAICGKADRMGLETRSQGGNWSPASTAKRLATAKANGVLWGRKPKAPAKPAPEPSAEPKPLGVDTACRWIAGDDPKTWLFCGHPQKPGAPYCPHHYDRAHAPQRAPQLPKKRIGMNLDRQFR